MNKLDYLNQNSLIRYPFKDGTPLTWSASASTGVLANNIFLDAIFTVLNQVYVNPRLTSIAYLKGVSASLDTWTLHLAISDTTTVSFNVAATGSGLATARASDNNVICNLELSIDNLSSYFQTNFSASDNLVFNSSANMMCAATIKYLAPVVTDVTFNNLKPDATVETVTVVSNTTGIDLQEGANLQYTGGKEMILKVVAGAGQGLFDACNTIDGLIYKINDISANAFSNYGITGDSCYKLVPGVNSLTIDNTCLPECTEAELQSFAYYLNRTKNGMLNLGDYLTQVKFNFDQTIAQYLIQVQAQLDVKAPYLVVNNSTSSNLTRDFNNLTCAVYSPSKQDLPSSLTVTVDGLFTLVPGTGYITQDKSKKPQDAIGYVSRTLKCNDVVYHGFVLQDDKLAGVSPINKGDPKFDVVFNLSTPTTQAYFSMPLLYLTPNFSAAYTQQRVNNQNIINLTIELLNKDNVSLNSSLAFNFPPQFQVISGSFIVDKVTVTPITTVFGFKNVIVDYSQTATYQAQFITDAAAGSVFEIETILTTPLGFSKKSIPFTIL